MESGDKAIPLVSKAERARSVLATLLFTLIVAAVLGLIGDIVGTYACSRFGGPATDPDDMRSLRCGWIFGAVLAITAAVISVRLFWPRRREQR